MAADIPVCDKDLFNRESVIHSREVDDEIRETSPVVWLSQENIAMLGRWEHVSAGLQNWQAFSNTSRPWHDANSVRPEILLTDDPPRHTQVRLVIGKTLMPKTLSRAQVHFDEVAERQIATLKDRAGEVVDAHSEICATFVHEVLPDLLGLPKEGRENMSAFGHAVWATMGPMNELFREAVEGSDDVINWATWACERENLAPDSLGMAMFEAADRGEITQDDAKLLTLTMLSAGADTTVMTMSTAIRAFCEFPDQYQLLRREPNLWKPAFDESLRWDSPSRMAGRITKQDVKINGYTIPEGTRCGLMFAAANRDPRKWPDPDRFDIKRDLRGHVGWGYGVHACVGRNLAQLEAQALLGALVKHIESFESAGEPEWWITTIGHGPAKLPIRFKAA
jgi:4-methoxybenzoate monooxygenase (O-demethylating)